MGKLQQFIKEKVLEPIKGKKFEVALIASLALPVGYVASNFANDLVDKNVYMEIKKDFVKFAPDYQKSEILVLAHDQTWDRFDSLIKTMRVALEDVDTTSSKSERLEVLKNTVASWSKEHGSIVDIETVDKKVKELRTSNDTTDFSKLKTMLSMDGEIDSNLSNSEWKHVSNNVDAMSLRDNSEQNRKDIELKEELKNAGYISLPSELGGRVNAWRELSGNDYMLVKDQVEAQKILDKLDNSDLSTKEKIEVVSNYLGSMNENVAINTVQEQVLFKAVYAVSDEVDKVMANDAEALPAAELMTKLSTVVDIYESSSEIATLH